MGTPGGEAITATTTPRTSWSRESIYNTLHSKASTVYAFDCTGVWVCICDHNNFDPISVCWHTHETWKKQKTHDAMVSDFPPKKKWGSGELRETPVPVPITDLSAAVKWWAMGRKTHRHLPLSARRKHIEMGFFLGVFWVSGMSFFFWGGNLLTKRCRWLVVWLGSISVWLIYRQMACYIFARLFLNYYTFQNVANTQNVKYIHSQKRQHCIYTCIK